MNSYKSHTEQILDYFREYKTVTSQQLRDAFHFADVRKPVSDLHKRGLVKKIGRKGNLAIYEYQGASSSTTSEIKPILEAVVYKDDDGNEFIRYEEVPAQIDVSSGNDRQTTLL